MTQYQPSTIVLKKWLWLILLTFSVVQVNAQTPGRFDYPDQPNLNYFKSYVPVSLALVSAPAHWKKNQWIVAGSVATAGVLLYVFDDQIADFFQKNQNTGLTNLSKYALEPWGSGVYPAVLMGSFYVYGLAAKDATARQVALGGTQAWVMSALTVQVIKHLTHRHRPYQDIPSNPRLWEGPFHGFEYTSFPSGHTITAFSLAAFLSSVYKDKPWVAIVSYGLATGVGLARVYDNQHWSSDVFIGAALGFGIGKLVFRMMKPNSKITLNMGSEGGVGLSYRF